MYTTTIARNHSSQRLPSESGKLRRAWKVRCDGRRQMLSSDVIDSGDGVSERYARLEIEGNSHGGELAVMAACLRPQVGLQSARCVEPGPALQWTTSDRAIDNAPGSSLICGSISIRNLVLMVGA